MHTLQLAQALISGSHKVTVCAYYEHDPVMVRQVEAVGAQVQLLGLPRDGSGKNLGRMPRLARKLREVFRQERPDVVHIQYMAPGVVPIMIARLCGVPRVFATVHVPARAYGNKLWFPKTAARLCDAFIHVSETAERSFWGSSAVFEQELLRDGRRHFTIHNCVDIELADRLQQSGASEKRREELGLKNRPVIGIVARVSAEKGQRWLLEAMRDVVRRMPEAALVIVGDGADRSHLEQETQAVGLTDNVYWLGRLAREEALLHYGVADVVVVPSKWEGFGLSAAEAMAFGKPVVASNVDGLQEVVDHQHSGLLVDYGDTHGLVGALCDLLVDGDRRAVMGECGRRRATNLFSWDSFKYRHLSLYE